MINYQIALANFCNWISGEWLQKSCRRFRVDTAGIVVGGWWHLLLQFSLGLHTALSQLQLARYTQEIVFYDFK